MVCAWKSREIAAACLLQRAACWTSARARLQQQQPVGFPQGTKGMVGEGRLRVSPPWGDPPARVRCGCWHHEEPEPRRTAMDLLSPLLNGATFSWVWCAPREVSWKARINSWDSSGTTSTSSEGSPLLPPQTLWKTPNLILDGKVRSSFGMPLGFCFQLLSLPSIR